jgi:hypothetical protein
MDNASDSSLYKEFADILEPNQTTAELKASPERRSNPRLAKWEKIVDKCVES